MMWKEKEEENHCGTPTGISLLKNQRFGEKHTPGAQHPPDVTDAPPRNRGPCAQAGGKKRKSAPLVGKLCKIPENKQTILF